MVSKSGSTILKKNSDMISKKNNDVVSKKKDNEIANEMDGRKEAEKTPKKEKRGEKKGKRQTKRNEEQSKQSTMIQEEHTLPPITQEKPVPPISQERHAPSIAREIEQEQKRIDSIMQERSNSIVHNQMREENVSCVIFSQYEELWKRERLICSVKHYQSKWIITLRNGILHYNQREILFGRCSCCFSFDCPSLFSLHNCHLE